MKKKTKMSNIKKYFKEFVGAMVFVIVIHLSLKFGVFHGNGILFEILKNSLFFFIIYSLSAIILLLIFKWIVKKFSKKTDNS